MIIPHGDIFFGNIVLTTINILYKIQYNSHINTIIKEYLKKYAIIRGLGQDNM